MILGLKPENVRVIFRRGSGCYGINGADTVTYDAALLSQAVGKPVRVQLSRKDEMAWENYGNAYVIDQRAGLDANGNIVAWDHEVWSPGLGNRPGPTGPGNVITGHAAGLRAGAVHAAIACAADPGRSTTTATACRRMWRRVGGAWRHRHRKERDACCRTPSNRRSSPGRCARRRACRTRSRTNRSWTSWRRT